jgi:membrane associated rhomboid family serine protease
MHVPSIGSRREPAINIPAPLLGWIGLLLAIHGARYLLADEADTKLLLEMAFVPAVWSIALGYATPAEIVAAAQAAGGGGEGAMRLALAQFFAQEPVRVWSALTYSLLHGSWAHVGLNSLWLVAFGTSVVRRCGAARSLVLWCAAAIGGAAAQWLSDPRSVDIMIGASASVSAFMAAAATFMYGRRDSGRWEFLSNRNALIFLGIWLAANFIFAVVAVPLGFGEAGIAWQAHIGGLVVGLALYPFLDPLFERPHRPRP